MKNNNNNLLFFDIFITILIVGTVTFIKDQSDYSENEKRYLEKIPRLSLSDYFRGQYQKNLEKALSDQFAYSDIIKKNYNKIYDITKPFRNNICIDTYIDIGNYRSIYGCSGYIVYNSKDTRIFPNKTNKLFELYNELNNITDVYYYIINTSIIYDFNTNKNTYNLSSIYKENLKGNYKLESFKFNNFKDYSKYFYKTDHHWNNKGSYKGYKDIMKMLGIDDIKKPTSTIHFNKVKYYGTHSQQTRYYDSYDRFSMYKFDIPNHETFIDGEKGIYGSLDLNINVEKDKEKNNTNMYAEYYGNDYGEVIFDFFNEEKENLLIISNSFDNAIDELIASHFNKTYIIDFRHNKDVNNSNLKDYIRENNINKVLIMSDYFFVDDTIKILMEEKNDIQ